MLFYTSTESPEAGESIGFRIAANGGTPQFVYFDNFFKKI